jgi:acetyl/propionyl-CoA carboxylase alpha subunit
MRWWVMRDGRRLEVSVRQVGEKFEVTLDGTSETVELIPVGSGLSALLCPDGRTFAVVGQEMGRGRWRISFGQMDFEVVLRDPLEGAVERAGRTDAAQQEIRAPIPGRVVSTPVQVGARVSKGQTVVVLEAMKMENQITAESDGLIEQIAVSPGATVEGGQLLVVIR